MGLRVQVHGTCKNCTIYKQTKDQLLKHKKHAADWESIKVRTPELPYQLNWSA